MEPGSVLIVCPNCGYKERFLSDEKPTCCSCGYCYLCEEVHEEGDNKCMSMEQDR